MSEAMNAWETARATSPTNEMISNYQAQIDAAEQMLQEALREYRIAAVQKACVWGWTVIAKDLGVSAKLLHQWHKEYCPQEKDLSGIPSAERRKNEKEARRAQRKAEKVAREAAEMERLAAELKNRKEQLNTLVYGA